MQLPESRVVSSIQLAASASSLLLLFVLLLSYCLLRSKLPQAFIPSSILLNITAINLLLSLKYLILGTLTLINGEQFRSHSFGIQTYDCDFEGFLTLTLFIFLTGWSLIWIFDLWAALNRRFSLQDDRSTYYVILIYFLGSILSLIFYFGPSSSPFALNPWNQTCYVKAGVQYYLSVDILLALYSLLSLLFLFKVFNANFISATTLSRNITMKKIYILLFHATNIWGVLFQVFRHPLLQIVFIFISAVQPGVFALPWIINAFNALKGYKTSLKTPVCIPTQHSFYDYAQEKLLDRESMDMTGSEHFNSESDSPSIRKGRVPLQKEIIELLIAGMEESFDEKRRRISMSANRKIFEQLSLKIPEQRSKCRRILCCCCFKLMFQRDYALTQEEVETQRGELVFGHTAVLNKVDLILKEAIIREAKVVRSYDVPINVVQAKKLRKVYNKPMGAYFKVTAPRVFRNLRRMHDISEELVSSAFSEIALKNKILKRDHQNKDGKIIIRAAEAKLKLVSLTKQEFSTLKAILPNFYAFFYMNPKSYMLPIYGCYTLQIGEENIFQPEHFILQPETIHSPFTQGSSLLHGRILTFEFKGSENYEQVLDDPRYLREPLDLNEHRIKCMVREEHPLSTNPLKFLSSTILRENDFFLSLIKLDVSNEQAHTILSQFGQDLQFLVAHNLCRYFTRLKTIYKPFTKLSLVQSLVSPASSYKREEGDLVIADDHEHFIILREQGVSYKFFHICENSSLQLIRQIEQEKELSVKPFGSLPDLPQLEPKSEQFPKEAQRLTKSQSFSHIHGPQHIINFELKGHQHLPLASNSSSYVPPSLDESVDLYHQLEKCRLCHQQFPRNHIIEVTHAPKSVTFGPSSDIVERDAIQQIIVDEEHGLIKREIHFCIQGYLEPGQGHHGFSQFFGDQEVKASEIEKYAQSLYHCMESVLE